MSRALHAANPALSASLKAELLEYHLAQTSSASSKPSIDPSNISHELRAWLDRRRAVLRTIDVAPMHSRAAVYTVHGFRRGLYAGNVDFYPGDGGRWIEERLAAATAASHPAVSPSETAPTADEGEGEAKEGAAASTAPALQESDVDANDDAADRSAFLSHAILDLPNSHHHLEAAARALRTNGTLVVFNPSIGQVQACVERVRALKLPLLLDRVLEHHRQPVQARKVD